MALLAELRAKRASRPLVTFIGITCLLLTGCATEPFVPPTSTFGYQRMLLSWKEKDINELIYSWGPPSSTFKMPNNNSMFTWDNITIGPTITSTSGSSVYARSGIRFGRSESVSFPNNWECHTTAIADASGKILGWFTKGNNCVLTYSPREYEQLMGSNRDLCKTLKKKTPILLHFILGAKETTGLDAGATARGLFMGYNGWEDTVQLLEGPVMTAYAIKYIEAVDVTSDEKQ